MANRPPSIFPLRVTQLWVAGEILEQPTDLEIVTVALGVDLPADAVAWLTEPPGAQHWGNANRLPQLPLRVRWRSAHAPVWNHRLVRPALVWDAEGVREEVLAVLRDGTGEQVRTAAPPPDEVADRLAAEHAISLATLDRRSREYGDRRWQPGKLERLADPLWHATEGYLDILEATR
jgi:hypothetical protein